MFNKKLNTNSIVSQSTSSHDSKYGQIRHLSGASSELSTFGPCSNLSTVSTSLSGPHHAMELRTISTYGTDIFVSDSAGGSSVLYHHPNLHHQVIFHYYLHLSLIHI